MIRDYTFFDGRYVIVILLLELCLYWLGVWIGCLGVESIEDRVVFGVVLGGCS